MTARHADPRDDWSDATLVPSRAATRSARVLVGELAADRARDAARRRERRRERGRRLVWPVFVGLLALVIISCCLLLWYAPGPI